VSVFKKDDNLAIYGYFNDNKETSNSNIV